VGAQGVESSAECESTWSQAELGPDRVQGVGSPAEGQGLGVLAVLLVDCTMEKLSTI
jgi:hypothetical protein